MSAVYVNKNLQPASLAFAVTPSDGTPLSQPARGLYVGVAGNVTVIMSGDPTGTAITFTAVPAGTFMPIQVSFVKATGTTASSIIALV